VEPSSTRGPRPARAQHLRPVRHRQADRRAKAQFRSFAEPWADTGTNTGRLMIAVLGGLADVERDLIRTRTAEGRSRAQKRGQHMGRPPKLTPTQQAKARKRRTQGATLAELARSYGVGKSTISGSQPDEARRGMASASEAARRARPSDLVIPPAIDRATRPA
jgi:Resolvase, N terminal domain/Helix-turn-helix domain of resolvase